MGKGIGNLGAYDDAEKSTLVTPHQALKMHLAFDHKKIICDYINSSLTKKIQYLKDSCLEKIKK